jgi:hypothetical protein
MEQSENNQSEDASFDQTFEFFRMLYIEKVIDKLKNSTDMLNEVFSWLAGCDIIHKIALVNKRFRQVA